MLTLGSYCGWFWDEGAADKRELVSLWELETLADPGNRTNRARLVP